MAATSPSQADEEDVGPTWQRQEAKHRQSQLRGNLNVEVPVAAPTGCFAGCFRPSPTSSRSSPPSCNSQAEGRRPVVDPVAVGGIRARGQSFASSARHARRRSGDFQYDARSYARNFDEGTDGEASGDEQAGLAAGDTLKYRSFASRLPPSPTPALSPSAAPVCDGGNSAKDSQTAREKGRDFD
ncbi:hypothetical protein OsI_33105 [Oryza sativa Indica Group]|uniref:Uncharacterized protein n=1 Tax=Oryza sativa subsp. indica TaxID=39946 RepID=A2Z628_ORYSI|nr:hypothetical protein OsI_33105 [Oryza sativa Indica Group]